MSSLLPSGCILIGMSCFCFLFSCPLAHCAVFHTHIHSHTRVHAVSHDFRSRCLPQSVSVNLILHTFVRTQKKKKKKIVSGIRFVCHLASFSLPLFILFGLFAAAWSFFSSTSTSVAYAYSYLCTLCVLAQKRLIRFLVEGKFRMIF